MCWTTGCKLDVQPWLQHPDLSRQPSATPVHRFPRDQCLISRISPDDLSSGRVELEPAGAVPFGIAPVPPRLLPDAVEHIVDRHRSKSLRMAFARLAPARIDEAAIVENGVVEIEQNRTRRLA